MVKMRSGAYPYLAVALFALAVIVLSLRLISLESRLLPLLVGSLVFVLAAIGFWRETRPERAERPAAGETGEMAGQPVGTWRSYLINTAWVFGLLAGIAFIGLVPAMAVFILLYMKWLGTRWLTSIIFGIVTPLLIYVVFERLMHIVLHRGMLFGG